MNLLHWAHEALALYGGLKFGAAIANGIHNRLEKQRQRFEEDRLVKEAEDILAGRVWPDCPSCNGIGVDPRTGLRCLYCGGHGKVTTRW